MGTIPLVTPIDVPADIQSIFNGLINTLNGLSGISGVANVTVQASSSLGTLPTGGIIGISATGGVGYAIADMAVGAETLIYQIVTSTSGNGNTITPATTSIVILTSGSTSAGRTITLENSGAAVQINCITPALWGVTGVRYVAS